MADDRYDSMEAWIASRPESVRKLAAEFPIESRLDTPDGPMWIIGYTEDDFLIISPINPFDDYDGAHEQKRYVCAHHYRSHQ
jgi:hypothetical protein